MNSWIDAAIAAATDRVHGIAQEVLDFPHITEHGHWRTTPDGVWTGGFWVGLLWLTHRLEGREPMRETALAWTDRLLPRAFDACNHDLGFMFYPSAIRA
jgi:unsaturated chondroitin disaccharide hydrolase